VCVEVSPINFLVGGHERDPIELQRQSIFISKLAPPALQPRKPLGLVDVGEPVGTERAPTAQ
jgi:hypothetical protein